MQIKCLFEKRISKDGKTEYYVLNIPDLEKVVFLSNVEAKLAKILFSKN